MTEDQLLKQFFAAISNQSDVLVAMSVAGLTGVYVTFIQPVRKPACASLLSIFFVALFFVVSLVCGYLINMALTGYYHEMIHGKGGSGPGSALEWFIAQYSDNLQILALLQLAASSIGILWLMILWVRICLRRTS